jgi:FMN reductase (NADPH)
MIENPTINAMMNRKSIRKFTDRDVTEEELETVARAGQQAPFAYQLCSVLLSRKRKRHPFNAPLLFTICVDSHRHELMMAERGWTMLNNDLSLLLFGIQDAAYMAENMVIAAESLGMGSCFLGGAPYQAEQIIKEYKLPSRVFPLVRLAMGFPAENPPIRPRYPLDFTLFEGKYPELTPEKVREAMKVMDDGYLAQEYYRKAKYKIPLEGKKEESYTYENYSWTEHISRKTGLWFEDPTPIFEQFEKCGFKLFSELQKKDKENIGDPETP